MKVSERRCFFYCASVFLFALSAQAQAQLQTPNIDKPLAFAREERLKKILFERYPHLSQPQEARQIRRRLERLDQEYPYITNVYLGRDEVGADCPFPSELLELHKSALYACDLSYGVKEDGALPRSSVLGFEAVATFLDHTGFKALVLERNLNRTLGYQYGKPQRIYAIAGAEVTENTDRRDIAADFGLGISQATSDAAIRAAQDAARFAFSGGEVVFTGQSLGGLLAQAVAYFAELNLERLEQLHGTRAQGRIHLVTWSVIGGKELLTRIHKTFGDDVLFAKSYSESSAERLAGVGYFFADDPFAIVGTFIGQSYVLPQMFKVSDDGKLYLPLPFLGKHLEGHFLPALKRASQRGAVCTARAGLPPKHSSALTSATRWMGQVAEKVLVGKSLRTTQFRPIFDQ